MNKKVNRVKYRLAAAVSPGIMLETHILEPNFKPTPGDPDALWSLRTIALPDFIEIP